MRKSRLMFVVIAATVFITLLCVNAFAAEQPVFEIEQVTATGGTSVRVPLKISNNNEGICGVTLTVAYDSRLTLTGIEKGEAFRSLTMTKPGNMNANPVNIAWDGMTADTSDGVIAYLTFTVPDAAGSYSINLSYIEGDILDGNISAVEAVVKSGSITVSAGEEVTGIIMKVGTLAATANSVVKVPVSLSGNTGICGATVSVAYDSRLTLSNIEKGDALKSLTMTKPGNMNANPVNIVWDGMTADTSDGVVAYLTFTVPDAAGTYPITISYTDGDILDGDISPVDVKMLDGAITVGGSREVTVTALGKSVTLTNNTSADGIILIAYYNGEGEFLSLEKYMPESVIGINNPKGEASWLKVMWWENTASAKPLAYAEEISLK